MGWFARIDPMIRLLAGAILLAVVLPVPAAAHDLAQATANLFVFLLFFLNGVRLPRREVMAGIANHRLLWPLALWCFGAMTAAGWLLWQAGQGWIPPLLALGFLYLGCLPSTVQSAAAYSSLAGGNVASSVVAAALLNMLGVFVTAPLFTLLAGVAGGELHLDGLLKVIGILLVPFILGQIVQNRMSGWVAGHRSLVALLDRGTIAIAVYVAFLGAVAQQFWERIEPADWLWLGLGTAAMLGFGHLGAWQLGRALGLDRPNRISMLFAGGQKSIAMGAPLATILFAPAVAGVVLLPILLYHLVQLMIAAPIAAALRRG